MRIEAEELPVGGEPEVSVAGSMCCYKTHVKRKWSFFHFLMVILPQFLDKSSL